MCRLIYRDLVKFGIYMYGCVEFCSNLHMVNRYSSYSYMYVCIYELVREIYNVRVYRSNRSKV